MTNVAENRDVVRTALDQVAEGDRVATRFFINGSKRGRRIRLEGITFSRLRDGHIVEDWSEFDSFELLSQLGLHRSLIAAPRMLRALRGARGS